MLTLYSGRPDGNRLAKEIKCYDLLDTLGVSYQRVDHSPTPAITMEVCAEISKSLDALICKNLFLCNRQQTAFYLLMMPGDKPFKTKYLSAQLGVSRLSFGDERFMEQFLDNAPGSATVLGLMNDTENRVQLVIDEDVLRQEWVGCHPCINTTSLRIHTADLTQKILPAIHHKPILVNLPWEDIPCTNP